MKKTLLVKPFHAVFLVFLFVLPTICLAQQDQIEKADAVFEYDSLHIYSSGKKAQLIKIYFYRSYRVKIQSEKGAKDFNEIILPEWHDPTLIIHGPEQHNIGKHLGGVNVDHFIGRILKPDGSTIDLGVKPIYETERYVGIESQRYEEANNFKYVIDDLEPGDILEINYRYSAKYDENFYNLITFRVFFHGEYPILRKDLSFSHPRELEVDVTTKNSEEPLVQIEEERTYSWHFDNLPVCLDESGIRPYLDLPHVIISLMPYDMIYTVPYSFEERFIPFYVFGPLVREKNHLDIVRAFLEGVNSKDYNYIRRYLEARTAGLPADTTGYSQLFAAINYIADNCSYEFNKEDYLYDETRKSRMGEFLASGKIRDRSRNDIYVGLIAGLNMGYFTAYLADNRTGEISHDYFEPTISNDYLFVALLKGGDPQFIYPKKERFGYYLNELPFYFENTRTQLLFLDDFRYYKTAIEEDFRSTVTPSSSFNDNVRHQSASVDVDVDNHEVKLDASISISGQFSTLGRGAYLYGSCDPSVNPAYCEKFGQSFSSTIKPEAYKITGVKQDYPFKAGIDVKFVANESLSKSGDTITLDLGGWFNHIIDANLNAENRVLNYYPDFKYTDTYTYQIKFSKEVEVLSHLPLARIENSYGGIMVNSQQQPDGSILIMSKLIVAADMIPAENIQDVHVMQEKIREINKMRIKVKVK